MHSIIRHVIRLQCRQRRVAEGGEEKKKGEGQHRASAWTAVGKKCLERGCVYIKDYVIVEGEGAAAAAAGKGAATGKALRGAGEQGEMEKRKNNSCSCSCCCCCSCRRGYRARLCKRCDNGHVNVVNGKSIGKAL